MQTLVIRFFHIPISLDGTQLGAMTYQREYVSLEQFLADYAHHYNQTYGTQGWSVSEAN